MNCLYNVYAVYTVYKLYTIQTAPHCLNSRMYIVCLYILVGMVRALFEWVEELLSKMLDGKGDWMMPLHIQKSWFRSWSRDFCQIFGGFRFWYRKQ